MRFRKKPVVIEAWKFERSDDVPVWVADALLKGSIGWSPDGVEMRIQTLEGVMTGRIGDWLIKGVKGELYPCKPDIFEATYEKVTEES